MVTLLGLLFREASSYPCAQTLVLKMQPDIESGVLGLLIWTNIPEKSVMIFWRYSDDILTILWRYFNDIRTIFWRYSDDIPTILTIFSPYRVKESRNPRKKVNRTRCYLLPYCRIFIVLLWYYYRINIVLLSYYYRIIIVLLSYYYRIIIVGRVSFNTIKVVMPTLASRRRVPARGTVLPKMS